MRPRSSERNDLLQILGVLDGPPVLPADGVDWLARTAYELTVDEYDAVIAITGKEGISKSVLALRLVLRLAELSKVPWGYVRLCYTVREILANYRTLLKDGTRSSSIWFDESVRGLLGGETFNPEQLALTRNLFQNRVVGAVLILCIPDIWALAKKVRGRRATFWVHVEKRGTHRNPAPSVARVHERDERIHYVPSAALGFSQSVRCPVLSYEPFDRDDPLWVEYRAHQKRRLMESFDQEIQNLDVVEAKRAKAARNVPVASE